MFWSRRHLEGPNRALGERHVDAARHRIPLQAVAPTARKAVDASDSDIAKAVGTRLSKDTQLKKVDVRSDAGGVTLMGQVPTIVAGAKASEMARGVSGVKSAKNELTFTK